MCRETVTKTLLDGIPPVDPPTLTEVFDREKCGAQQLDGHRTCPYPDGNCLKYSDHQITGDCILPKSTEF